MMLMMMMMMFMMVKRVIIIRIHVQEYRNSSKRFKNVSIFRIIIIIIHVVVQRRRRKSGRWSRDAEESV